MLVFLTAGCATDDGFGEATFETPETAIEYEVVLNGAPSEEIDALLRASLSVFLQQEDGAQSAAFLRRRGRGDIETVGKIMRSYGYYESETTVEVTEEVPAAEDGAETPTADDGETASETPTDDEADTEDGAEPEDPIPAVVTVTVDPGRPFTLVSHTFVLDGIAVLPSAASLGAPIGEPAEAAKILAAEGAAVATLRNNGHPYAQRMGREAVADLEKAEIEVTTTISPGPDLVFGKTSFVGIESIDTEYLLTYLPWSEGDVLDARKLKEYQGLLIETGLFDAATVAPPQEPPTGSVGDVTATVEQRLPRTFSAGARYSTDQGPAVRLGYEHRNLFGAGERLNGDVIAGTEEQSLTVRYRKPQYLRDGQDFLAGLSLRRETNDAFDELGATLTAGFERELSDVWTVGAGGLLEASQSEQSNETTTSYLGGLPVFAAFDTSDDLLDPSKGTRGRIGLTPFGGLSNDEPVTFLLFDATAAAYYDLTGDRDYILAGRGRIATVVGADVDEVPPPHRLYSGGGGSVRGYRERGIGPLDDGDDPTGGLSAVELGIEMRAKVTNDIGIAVFSEAGSVSEDSYPDFDEGVQLAAGAGVRYFSPVGPIRVDVGVPLNPRDADDNFQVYISIGQAF